MCKGAKLDPTIDEHLLTAYMWNNYYSCEKVNGATGPEDLYIVWDLDQNQAVIK